MTIAVDVLIFGGGCAGLWLLDALRRHGYRALLAESQPLGAGQTGIAQGILHSGLKYLFHPGQAQAAAAFGDVPQVWRDALAGRSEPNLSRVPVRAEYCHLWRTDSLRSWLGMTLAQHGLKTRPVPVPQHERPSVLASCAGHVYRLDEPVIDTRQLLAVLSARNARQVWWISPAREARFVTSRDGSVQRVMLKAIHGRGEVEVQPHAVVFAAGAGNAHLREAVGLPSTVMQRRPLHVAFVRGKLPLLFGHCVDGTGTRVTITSAACEDGTNVWQLGGRISETGVNMTEETFLQLAASELRATLPDVRLDGCTWQARSIDRAEAKTSHAGIPHGAQLIRDQNVFTVWPTKLALAPTVPALVMPHIERPSAAALADFNAQAEALHWSAPPLAAPPWQESPAWQRAA